MVYIETNKKNSTHDMQHTDWVWSKKCSETKPKRCWTGELH